MTTKVSKDLIASGSITTDHIVDGAVEGSKLADSAVGADKLEDGAVTGDKLASDAITLSSIRADRNQRGKLISIDAFGNLIPVTHSDSRRLLHLGDLANQASVNIAPSFGFGAYSRCELLLQDVSLEQTDCFIFMRFSDEGGLTWYSGSNDYRYSCNFEGANQSGRLSAIPLTWSSVGWQISNGANEMFCGYLSLNSMATGFNPTVHFQVSYTRKNLSIFHAFLNGSGQLDRVGNVTKIQLYATTHSPDGDRVRFKTGRALLYGLV